MPGQYYAPPLVERVLDKVMVQANGCWLWQGTLNRAGYGVVKQPRGPMVRVHRVVYESYAGSIPNGLDLDHLCYQPTCVNPAHLEPVTRAENVRRAWAAGRYEGKSSSSAKTHCPKGHPYDEVNTYVNPQGKRLCRECQRAAAREYQRRKRREL